MTDQAAKAHAFHALHVKSDPIVLFNIWDAGTAKIVAAAGAKAIATGSHPVASAFGYEDGEKFPLDLALENIRRIVAATDLPVTMDLEGGYGVDPATCAETTRKAIDAGAIGFNFEDQVVGGSGLHDIPVQVKRIEAVVEAVKASGVPAFVNARTDLFLKTKPDGHSEALVDQALERAAAYEKAGAHGLFAPGIGDEKLIEKLVTGTNLPVNIIALPHVPLKDVLMKLNVARISYGPVPWRRMAAWLDEQARDAFG